MLIKQAYFFLIANITITLIKQPNISEKEKYTLIIPTLKPPSITLKKARSNGTIKTKIAKVISMIIGRNFFEYEIFIVQYTDATMIINGNKNEVKTFKIDVSKEKPPLLFRIRHYL